MKENKNLMTLQKQFKGVNKHGSNVCSKGRRGIFQGVAKLFKLVCSMANYGNTCIEYYHLGQHLHRQLHLQADSMLAGMTAYFG